jgi:micrococcal nuclease
MPEIMHLTYTYDGDTLGAPRDPGSLIGQEPIRLAYIDAPEIAQSPWGIRARTCLRTLLMVNERIQVDIKNRDKYV